MLAKNAKDSLFKRFVVCTVLVIYQDNPFDRRVILAKELKSLLHKFELLWQFFRMRKHPCTSSNNKRNKLSLLKPKLFCDKSVKSTLKSGIAAVNNDNSRLRFRFDLVCLCHAFYFFFFVFHI